MRDSIFRSDIISVVDEGVKEWPHHIELFVVHDGSDRYHVRGLYEIEEEIVGRYLGRSEAIIKFNLHDAIYEVIHGLDLRFPSIANNIIDKENVRRILLRRIWYTISQSDLGWNEGELDGAREFVSRNDPYGEHKPSDKVLR